MSSTPKISLVLSNNALKSVLESALVQAELPYIFFDSVDDLPQKSDFMLCMTDIEDFKSDIPVFGVFDRNIIGFTKICHPPLRLGQFIEEIKEFLKQKSRTEALKPIKMGTYNLDPRNNALTLPHDGVDVKLTDKEQDILLYLYSQKEKRTSREALLGHVWHYAGDVETHTLETHIYRLRQKIEVDPAAPQFLMTDDEGYYLKL